MIIPASTGALCQSARRVGRRPLGPGRPLSPLVSGSVLEVQGRLLVSRLCAGAGFVSVCQTFVLFGQGTRLRVREPVQGGLSDGEAVERGCAY